MENSICITPVDGEMAVLAKAIYLLNEYKVLGYKSRKAFVDLIISVDDSFQSLENIEKLYSFWSGRVKDTSLNHKLEKIIKQLS